jgi:hypothetical protein
MIRIRALLARGVAEVVSKMTVLAEDGDEDSQFHGWRSVRIKDEAGVNGG